MDLNIYFARVTEGSTAKIPIKESEDMARDIYAYFEEDNLVIPAFKSKLVPTGIATAFSSDYGMILRERGSTGILNMKVNAGVIDSGYRGEIFVCLYNGNSIPIVISKDPKEYFKEYAEGDYIVYPYEKAVCQALMVKVDKFKEVVVNYNQLFNMKSKRGNGSLGSSGK